MFFSVPDNESTQIIVTSHDLTPSGRTLCKVPDGTSEGRFITHAAFDGEILHHLGGYKQGSLNGTHGKMGGDQKSSNLVW